ncbi:MAG: hypothetical protein AB7S80_14250 [Rhizobiaceae bacterium]
MANPARKFDDPRPVDPTVAADPFNPMPLTPDPVADQPYANANDPRIVQNRVDVQSERRTGTSVLIAAVVLIIALVAYLVFASNPESGTVAPEGSAVTTPADPVAPAEPNAIAPAEPMAPADTGAATGEAGSGATNSMAPADPAAPAPEAVAPAEPAPAPGEPATPAPAPAE